MSLPSMPVTSLNSSDDNNGNTNSGMQGVEQEVFVIDIVNVAIVRIRPSRWPRIYKFKPVSGVLESRTILNQDNPFYTKSVFVAKVLAKSIIWNTRPALRTARSLSLGSRLPSIVLSIVIFVLGAPALFRGLSLLLLLDVLLLLSSLLLLFTLSVRRLVLKLPLLFLPSTILILRLTLFFLLRASSCFSTRFCFSFGRLGFRFTRLRLLRHRLSLFLLILLCTHYDCGSEK